MLTAYGTSRRPTDGHHLTTATIVGTGETGDGPGGSMTANQPDEVTLRLE